MGSKSDTDRALADLDHALAALGDGAGQEVWGPGRILSRMLGKDLRAQQAFEMAASISYNVMLSRTPARMTHDMRVLAPVLLELLIASEQDDAEELAGLFENVDTVSEA